MTKEASLDFCSLDTAAASEKLFELELVHPVSKKPLGVFVSVVGAESSEIKSFIRQNINRDRMKEFQAQRSPSKAVPPDTIEEEEADTIRLAAKLVKGWRTVKDGKSEPVIHWNSDKLDCTAENATRWLTAFPWARGQIIEASGELGNFMGN